MKKSEFLSKYKFVLIAVAILFFGICDTINLYKMPSILETLSGSFNLDRGDLSNIMTVYSLCAAIMAIPTGYLSDKLGAKRIIIIGIICSMVGAFLGAMSFA